MRAERAIEGLVLDEEYIIWVKTLLLNVREAGVMLAMAAGTGSPSAREAANRLVTSAQNLIDELKEVEPTLIGRD